MFRTEIKSNKLSLNIDHSSKLMFLGSCFTNNIGNKLNSLKFKTDINPFGILYNPISIKKSIDILLSKNKFSEDDVFKYNEQWHSFYHHSDFSNSNLRKSLDGINTRIKESSNFLENADTIFITFGTAWIYRHKETKKIVSNCHKLPTDKFTRHLLSVEAITVEYIQVLNNLKIINPNINIVFTISPIRHLKDGFSENNLSKSILKVAIHQILEHIPNTFYFPALEIMQDDLRDYRFYDYDMIHPNQTAIDYIFKNFSYSFFEKETSKIIDEIKKILKAKNHKPFNLKSKGYKEFVNKNLKNIYFLKKKFPELNFNEEIEFFKRII